MNRPPVWSDLNHQRSFLERVGKYLNVKQFEDWYKVKVRDVIRYRGAQSLLAQVTNNLFFIFSTVIPFQKRLKEFILNSNGDGSPNKA